MALLRVGHGKRGAIITKPDEQSFEFVFSLSRRRLPAAAQAAPRGMDGLILRIKI